MSTCLIFLYSNTDATSIVPKAQTIRLKTNVKSIDNLSKQMQDFQLRSNVNTMYKKVSYIRSNMHINVIEIELCMIKPNIFMHFFSILLSEKRYPNITTIYKCSFSDYSWKVYILFTISGINRCINIMNLLL